MPRNRPRPIPPTARRRGMIWMDTLIGLSLIVAMTGALVATQTQHRRTNRALSEQRHTIRVLESQASRLLAGQAIDTPGVTRSAAGGGWVRLVSTDQENQPAELFVYLGSDPPRGGEGGQP